MGLFIVFVSFIVFILINYLGGLALELLLLSVLPGSENIMLFYYIGSKIIICFFALPVFMIINKASIRQIKTLFIKKREVKTWFMISAVLSLLALTIIPMLMIHYFSTDEPFSPPDMITGIWLVLITPVIEEMIFRGVMLQKLKKYGIIPAVLISSFLFAIGHGNVGNMLISFLPGIILAIVAIKSESISYTIPLHMLLNLCGSVIFPLVLSA